MSRAVAIIGAGIGREHLAGYEQLPDRFRVKAVCDLDAARAADVVGDRGIAIQTNVEACMADPDIDLIDICLPPHLHFETAVAALRAGKDVICEKPLVNSVAEADRLIGIAAKTGRQVFPVFQYRYGPAMDRLTALRNAGLAGEPYVATLETHWDRGADYYAVAWRGTWAGERGGAVLCHAIHNHDLLVQIMGPVKRVSAFCGTRVNAIETEDCAAVSFQLENGAMATSSVTLGAAGNVSRLRLCFEHLTVESGRTPYAPAMDDWTFTARDPARQPEVDETLTSIGPGLSGFAGFFEAVDKALAGRPERHVSLEDGRRSIELVAAIYQSARTGKAVEMPLGSDSPTYENWLPGN